MLEPLINQCYELGERSNNVIWQKHFMMRLELFRANNPRRLGQWTTLDAVESVQDSCDALRDVLHISRQAFLCMSDIARTESINEELKAIIKETHKSWRAYMAGKGSGY